MKFTMPLALSAMALALTGASAANAQSIHYNFSPGSYFNNSGSLDHSSVTGSFDFDPVTNTLSNVDYTSVFGHYTVGSEYNPGVDTQIYFGTFGTSNYDVYQLATGLSGASPVLISSGTNPTVFISAGGSLTATVSGAVPEPATWAMMILGMGAVGFTMRRRSKRTVRVTHA